MATAFDFVNFTDPDAQLFKTRFPVFTPVSDGLVTMIMNEVMADHVNKVNKHWLAEDFQPAVLYLTAHFLTMEGEPDRAIQLAKAAGTAVTTGGATTGNIIQAKVGDVDVKFSELTGAKAGSGIGWAGSNPDTDRLTFMTTHFGKMYIKLRKKNFHGAHVVA